MRTETNIPSDEQLEAITSSLMSRTKETELEVRGSHLTVEGINEEFSRLRSEKRFDELATYVDQLHGLGFHVRPDVKDVIGFMVYAASHSAHSIQREHEMLAGDHSELMRFRNILVGARDYFIGLPKIAAEHVINSYPQIPKP